MEKYYFVLDKADTIIGTFLCSCSLIGEVQEMGKVVTVLADDWPDVLHKKFFGGTKNKQGEYTKFSTVDSDAQNRYRFDTIRDSALSKSDWTQIPGNHLTVEQCIAANKWRQQLRDVPSKTKDAQLQLKRLQQLIDKRPAFIKAV